MLATCRRHSVMSANFAKNVCLQRHGTGKKSPRHSQFVCRFANTIQIQHSWPLQTTGKEEYSVVHGLTTRSGGGGTHSAGGCICGGGKHNNQPDNDG